MNAYKYILCLLMLFVAFNSNVNAQTLIDAPTPEAIVTNKDNEEEILGEGDSFTGEAPLKARFLANAKEYEDFICACEWTFKRDEEVILKRFDKDVDYDFNEAGTFTVHLFVTYTNKNNIEDIREYEYEPFQISISESTLKVPNAFSPNGDGINDYFNVFEVKSIISFSAAIYNRWGQQLYKWGIEEMDCESCGWDGTYDGSPVKEGVYFVVVEALGADGIKYNIRSAVNLLRGYTEETSK